jgi:hypothetical protein
MACVQGYPTSEVYRGELLIREDDLREYERCVSVEGVPWPEGRRAIPVFQTFDVQVRQGFICEYPGWSGGPSVQFVTHYGLVEHREEWHPCEKPISFFVCEYPDAEPAEACH